MCSSACHIRILYVSLCIGPPSACWNIRAIFVRDRSLDVQWERPAITGRDDFYYVLEYSDGEVVGSNQVINQSQVVSQLITGLKPATEYTITVTVVNGVSDQDRENEFKRRCRLTATTGTATILLISTLAACRMGI